MHKSDRAAQARQELDRKFDATNLEPIQARPRSGWIRAIRSGLGMSQAALASRLGISTPSMAKLEKSEVNETIGIGKLAEVARALDCTLVYALLPNTSIEDTVQKQARRVAAETLSYVANTMQIEDQTVEVDRQADQLEMHARKVIENSRLWRAV